MAESNENVDLKTFGGRLYYALKINKITYKKFAQDIDVTVRQVINYIHNRSEPNFKTLVKIADYFGVSVDYLAGRDEVFSNPKLGHIFVKQLIDRCSDAWNEEEKDEVERAILEGKRRSKKVKYFS